MSVLNYSLWGWIFSLDQTRTSCDAACDHPHRFIVVLRKVCFCPYPPFHFCKITVSSHYESLFEWVHATPFFCSCASWRQPCNLLEVPWWTPVCSYLCCNKGPKTGHSIPHVVPQVPKRRELPPSLTCLLYFGYCSLGYTFVLHRPSHIQLLTHQFPQVFSTKLLPKRWIPPCTVAVAQGYSVPSTGLSIEISVIFFVCYARKYTS